MPTPEIDTKKKPLTFSQVMFSVLASAFGVQSSENRERDFTRGSPIHFIVSGILFTVLFVALMLLLVNTILSKVT
ncbi:MAG: DUF2970 domain-containing protein [Halioglobus sp.]